MMGSGVRVTQAAPPLREGKLLDLRESRRKNRPGAPVEDNSQGRVSSSAEIVVAEADRRALARLRLKTSGRDIMDINEMLRQTGAVEAISRQLNVDPATAQAGA